MESRLYNLVHIKKNRDHPNGADYYNIPAAFDIETSSFYTQDGSKYASMYIWQFGIGDHVTSGRDWFSFVNLIANIRTILELDAKKLLVVYIHNLAYEFQFMRNWFDWQKVFLTDSRQPLYALSTGIEYRCSLKLYGGRSLKAVGETLLHHDIRKMAGDLDYSLIRNQFTPLTEKELKYCENDILVLTAAIMEKIQQDGDITQIPLTNTGYVRRFVKRKCMKQWKKFGPIIKQLTLTPSCYNQLRSAYQGGFTHANSAYVNKIINKIASFDFASSYPAVMCLRYFPMSAPIFVEDDYAQINLEEFLNNYCCMFDIELSNVESKLEWEHPISISKCRLTKDERSRVTQDNGRIVSAPILRMTITELDWQTYQEFYTFDANVRISNLILFERGRLPKPIIDATLELYGNKTSLKGIKGKELEYMVAKNMLNAIYGMMVTNIIHEIWEYLDGEFMPVRYPDLEEEINRYNAAKGRFLYYPWGVWITAHARRNLFQAIRDIGHDYVYSDTDCVKILNWQKHIHIIINYNQRIRAEIKEASRYYLIPVEKFCPKDKKGKRHPIGIWTYNKKEDFYDRFKTLGAKRYLTQLQYDGSYHMTVAGLNKSKGMEYLIHAFDDPFDGFYIPVCEPWETPPDTMEFPPEYSGRLVMAYDDSARKGFLTDYMGITAPFEEKSAVHMEPSTYRLSVSADFERYLQTMIDEDDMLHMEAAHY